MSKLGTRENPCRIAIVGAGPSGFYAADALFKSGTSFLVDAFDKLATPFGLLRGGVAPDHQQMKSVGKYYERVALKNKEQFSFYGNVEIGKDLSVEDLQKHYDAIIFSYGSDSDRQLGIPGESLTGSFSAREFVAWYNGHPDYTQLDVDLSQDAAIVIGQGNVAMDVARILAKTPKELASSDIAGYAQEALKKSSVKTIHIIGRRGPIQAAFTQLEIKEFGELEDCDIVINPNDLQLSQSDREELEDPKNNKAKKNYEVLAQLAKKPIENKSKKVIVHFFKSPKAIHGTESMNAMTLGINALEGAPFQQKVRDTGKEEMVSAGLVFRSIGYKGLPMAGVPFDDQQGIIPNKAGNVLNNTGQAVPGMYTSGWIKRGPSGVLGTNKMCSQDTVNSILADLDQLQPCPERHPDAIKQLLKERHCHFVSYDDYQKIDAEEQRRGKEKGKPREKFTSTEKMLEFVQSICLV